MIKRHDEERLIALFRQIRDRQDREGEHTNYKDAPALHEMAALIRPYAVRLDAAEDPGDIGAVCRFLGESYREMGRGVYAAEFFTYAFLAAVRVSAEDKEDLFADAVKTRNWYVDDPCPDLKEAARRVLDPLDVETIFARASKRTMKRDPVEMTPEYLAVIDGVEQKAEENMTFQGMGSCHQRWSLTCEYLEEKGILWRSPAMMNPGWRFD